MNLIFYFELSQKRIWEFFFWYLLLKSNTKIWSSNVRRYLRKISDTRKTGSLLWNWWLIFLFLFAYILIRAWSSVPIIFETEFSLRYLLIFEDQILVPDFTSRYQKKNSQMRFWENSETRIHWSMINIIEKIKKSFLGYIQISPEWF